MGFYFFYYNVYYKLGVFYNEIMLENKIILLDDDWNVLILDVEDVKKVCGCYISIYYLLV